MKIYRLTIEDANSCPYLKGTAVYKARSINNYFHPEQVYNDWSLCAALYANKGTDDLYAMTMNENSKPIGGQSSFTISPNPTSGNVLLSFSHALTQEAELKVTDMTGRIRKIMVIDANVNQTEIPLLELEPGVYLLNLTTQGKNMGKEKLIIRP